MLPKKITRTARTVHEDSAESIHNRWGSVKTSLKGMASAAAHILNFRNQLVKHVHRQLPISTHAL